MLDKNSPGPKKCEENRRGEVGKCHWVKQQKTKKKRKKNKGKNQKKWDCFRMNSNKTTTSHCWGKKRNFNRKKAVGKKSKIVGVWEKTKVGAKGTSDGGPVKAKKKRFE